MEKNNQPIQPDALAQRVPLRFAAWLAAILVMALLAIDAAWAASYTFTSLAGASVALDHTDGTGGNARFLNPTGAAVDGSGNLYVADQGDHTIRKIAPGGVVTTLAGNPGVAGSVDGSGASAEFVYPYGVAVDASGNVYVADNGNNTIRKITPAGAVTTIAGSATASGSFDGGNGSATFNGPQGIAVDTAGNVYVCDSNNSTIRKIDTGGVVSTLAGSAGQTGSADGTGSSARFNYPGGIAVDSAGNIFVADFGNSTIREVSPSGAVTTVAGSAGQYGSIDATAGSARFNHPEGVALDSAGNIYVVDTSNQVVREIASGGVVTTLAGSPGLGGHSDGSGTAAAFFYPNGIAATAAGTVYIADTGNHSIRQLSGVSVTTVAGAVGTSGSSDGTGSAARFDYPDGVAVDASGNVYVADQGNSTIRKITSGGSVSTLAGMSGTPGSADGTGTSASFNSPSGVAVDASGNVYVADQGNSTIRKITSGGVVSTFAGSAGQSGSADGMGSAARFANPQGIAVDSSGNIWVADTHNDTVREITPAGAVTTIAGSAGQTGRIDGTGSAARFNGPYALTVDNAGNVYVGDFFNDTIRKITSGGAVTTVAGFGGVAGDADGNGTNARFNQTYGLSADSSGNIFVADTYNRVIRIVTPAGVVSTLTGTAAQFYYPQGVAVGASGTVYVSDGDNQSILSGSVGSGNPPPSGGGLTSSTVAPGGSTTFTLGTAASGTTYQWQISTNGSTWTNLTDGGNYSGSGTVTLTVTGATTAMDGNRFQAVLTTSSGMTTSGTATLYVGTVRLINLSARAYVDSGDPLIAGLVISGSGSKQVLLRAIGPTLTLKGVSGALTSPELELDDGSGTLIASNTTWGGGATLANAFTAVGAFSLASNSADDALYQPLNAGAYTGVVTGMNGTSGVALVEVYDADSPTSGTRLINLAGRAYVGTGGNILIGGFVVSGSTSETVLIRGVGPGLTSKGVSNALAQPQINLVDSSGNSVATNAGWGGGATLSAVFQQVGAFALDPSSADSALVVSLPPGAYTAEISGVNGTQGTALLEIYEVR